ncbi:MAG: hypothetical protein V1754_06890 [Pseudomonadota bacterium]
MTLPFTMAADTPGDIGMQSRSFSALAFGGGCCLFLLATFGCSSNGNPSQPEAGPYPDLGLPLYPCSSPGKVCNAHEPCAINPVCGEDLLCHPESIQTCDDKLDCTEDVCKGGGVCENTPKANWCALAIKSEGKTVILCHKPDAANPEDSCLRCDPKASQTEWTPITGGSCDDNNPCTKDDYCQAGECKGIYFGDECNDDFECTDDICDGKGGCFIAMRTGWCQIDGVCFESGQTDASRCYYCHDVKAPKEWTPVSNVCKIGAVCYQANEIDTTGCGICDPKTDATNWSSNPGTCLINGICKKAGDKDITECGVCEPQTNPTEYTPISGKCLIKETCFDDNALSPTGCGICKASSKTGWWATVSGANSSVNDFESSLGDYTVDPAINGVGWQLSTERAYAGQKSLYYGNPTNKNYDSGELANKGKATSAPISLPANKKAALHFWLYMDTETTPTFDMLTVAANDTVVWQKSATSLPLAYYRKWIPIEVDLSAYAGTNVALSFEMDTVDAWANTGKGVYLDNITIITNCGAL